MNEYNDPNAAFNGIINSNGLGVNPQVTPAQPYTDPHPYGPPTPHHGQPVKTGLTPRGKAALAIAATLMAGGGLLGWQHHADTTAANDLKAKELALQQQKLQVEQQKALDKANQAAQKTQTAADRNRQKQIDACVEANKDLVGKQLGQTLSGVISDCQAQYPAASTDTGMQEAASSTSTDSGTADWGVLVLLGLVTVTVGVATVVKKASKSAPAPAPGPYPYPPYYPHA